MSGSVWLDLMSPLRAHRPLVLNVLLSLIDCRLTQNNVYLKKLTNFKASKLLPDAVWPTSARCPLASRGREAAECHMRQQNYLESNVNRLGLIKPSK